MQSSPLPLLEFYEFPWRSFHRENTQRDDEGYNCLFNYCFLVWVVCVFIIVFNCIYNRPAVPGDPRPAGRTLVPVSLPQATVGSGRPRASSAPTVLLSGSGSGGVDSGNGRASGNLGAGAEAGNSAGPSSGTGPAKFGVGGLSSSSTALPASSPQTGEEPPSSPPPVRPRVRLPQQAASGQVPLEPGQRVHIPPPLPEAQAERPRLPSPPRQTSRHVHFTPSTKGESSSSASRQSPDPVIPPPPKTDPVIPAPTETKDDRRSSPDILLEAIAEEESLLAERDKRERDRQQQQDLQRQRDLLFQTPHLPATTTSSTTAAPLSGRLPTTIRDRNKDKRRSRLRLGQAFSDPRVSTFEESAPTSPTPRGLSGLAAHNEPPDLEISAAHVRSWRDAVSNEDQTIAQTQPEDPLPGQENALVSHPDDRIPRDESEFQDFISHFLAWATSWGPRVALSLPSPWRRLSPSERDEFFQYLSNVALLEDDQLPPDMENDDDAPGALLSALLVHDVITRIVIQPFLSEGEESDYDGRTRLHQFLSSPARHLMLHNDNANTLEMESYYARAAEIASSIRTQRTVLECTTLTVSLHAEGWGSGFVEHSTDLFVFLGSGVWEDCFDHPPAEDGLICQRLLGGPRRVKLVLCPLVEAYKMGEEVRMWGRMWVYV